MKFKFTDGFVNGDFSKVLTLSDSYKLAENEKKSFIAFSCSAASKVLTLDLADGDQAIVSNIGDTNAVTVKNVAGDTGTSLAAGKVALVVASTTADGSKVVALN